MVNAEILLVKQSVVLSSFLLTQTVLHKSSTTNSSWSEWLPFKGVASISMPDKVTPGMHSRN
jgi:hypothetical protein